jgi:hypothetical protein
VCVCVSVCVCITHWSNYPPHLHSLSSYSGHVGEWFNNTAHSNGVHGLRIYPSYQPLLNPCGPKTNETTGLPAPSAPQTFRNFTSFHNGDNGIFGKRNGDIHHVGSKLIENRGGEYKQLFLIDGPFTAYPNIKDALLVGSIDPATAVNVTTAGFSAPQNENYYISNVQFVNYGRSATAISLCEGCESDVEYAQGGWTYRVRGLQFINVVNKVTFNAPFKEILFDLDGSLTGYVNGSLIPYTAYNSWPGECNPAGNDVLPMGLLCNGNTRVRRLVLSFVQPKELDWQVLVVSSVVGSSSVMFRPKTEYGWVLPLVMGHRYSLNFVSLIDWQQMALQISTGDLLGFDADIMKALASPGTSSREWASLSFNYTYQRWQYEVAYPADGRTRPWLNSSLGVLPGGKDAFGTGVTGLNEHGQVANAWTVALSAANNITYGLNISYNLTVRALQCPNEGCFVPTVSDNVMKPLNWSSNATWPSGRIPRAGDKVVIPADKWVVLDQDSGDLDLLQILGTLQFADTRSITLSATRIAVFGTLLIGNTTAPYVNNATILLRGVVASPVLAIDNTLFLGNKVLAVFGSFKAFGRPRAVTWTRLASTAAVGSTSIVVNGAVDWRVGESIVISPTEYDASQLETVVISKVTAVAGGDSLVEFAPALRYLHSVADIRSVTRGTGVLAATVGLLDRNVKILGEYNTPADGYGGHIFVSEIVTGATSSSPVIFRGNLALDSVQLQNMGKQGTQYAGVVSQFQNAASLPASLQSAERATVFVSGCAFAYQNNYGLDLSGPQSLVLNRTVVHRSARSAVSIDERVTAAMITDNLVTGVSFSPDAATTWISPVAGFILNSPPARLVGNVVAGSQDGGFTLHGDLCTTGAGALKATSMSGNEVHSAKTGFFLHSKFVDGAVVDCVQITGLTAWKISHVAVLGVDQTANVIIANATIADSHIGVSLNFFRQHVNARADVVNTFIIGATTASSCSQSTSCRAQSKSDLRGDACSSVTPLYRSVGIMTSAYLNAGKTCRVNDIGFEQCRPYNTPFRLCGMPWEKKYGLPSTATASLNVANTVFANFTAAGGCGLQVAAVLWNPTQADFTPPLFFSGVQWAGVDEAAKVYFGPQGSTDGKCTSAGCDGMNSIVAVDKDGSFLGLPGGGSIIGRNPSAAVSGCTEVVSWYAFRCPGITYRMGTFENMDPDTGVKIFGPLTAIDGVGGGSSFTFFSKGVIDDGCAMRFYFGRYPVLLIPGRITNITFTGTMPSNLRLTLMSPDPTESFAINLFYTKPFQLEVYLDSSFIADNNGVSYPDLTSTSGANQFDPQVRRLFVTLRGNAKKWPVYDFRTSPVVQVTLKLAMKFEDFYGPKLVLNLATLLKIPFDRIKIVSVGSSVARMLLGDSHERRSRSLLADSLSVDMMILPPVVSVNVSVVTNSTTNSSSISSPSSSAASSSDADLAALQAVRLSAQMAELAAVVASLSNFTSNATALSSALQVPVAAVTTSVTVPPSVTTATLVTTEAPTLAPTLAPTGSPTTAPPNVTKTGSNDRAQDWWSAISLWIRALIITLFVLLIFSIIMFAYVQCIGSPQASVKVVPEKIEMRSSTTDARDRWRIRSVGDSSGESEDGDRAYAHQRIMSISIMNENGADITPTASPTARRSAGSIPLSIDTTSADPDLPAPSLLTPPRCNSKHLSTIFKTSLPALQDAPQLPDSARRKRGHERNMSETRGGALIPGATMAHVFG